MQLSKLIAITIAFCSVVAIVITANAGNSEQAQELRMMDRRVALLEQRLYSIESSISRLELAASSQRAASTTASARDAEVSLLRDEIQRLRQRVSETECGLLKLDERTTPTSNRKTTVPGDPCRQNPSAPLQLSPRP